MKNNIFIKAYLNNSFDCPINSLTPDNIDGLFERLNEDQAKITAFDFYVLDEDGDYEKSSYFIGRITDYEEVKDFINKSSKSFNAGSDYAPNGKVEKFKVTYDENGNICDVDAIYSMDEKVFPVNDSKELENVYYQITGKEISLEANSMSK